MTFSFVPPRLLLVVHSTCSMYAARPLRFLTRTTITSDLCAIQIFSECVPSACVPILTFAGVHFSFGATGAGDDQRLQQYLLVVVPSLHLSSTVGLVQLDLMRMSEWCFLGSTFCAASPVDKGFIFLSSMISRLYLR